MSADALIHVALVGPGAVPHDGAQGRGAGPEAAGLHLRRGGRDGLLRGQVQRPRVVPLAPSHLPIPDGGASTNPASRIMSP